MTESEFEALKVGGTEVNYFMVCRRKLWLYTHRLDLERSSEQVSLGALLHETAYCRLPKRELLVDSLIKVDIMESSGKVVEVKYSQKMEEAARLQVIYYLYYLKRKGVSELVGELRFPRQRRREEVVLTEENEGKIETTLRKIKEVKDLLSPPKAEWGAICRRCAYSEFCWG
ncbi:CRISPR-associated protein Cas4 [Dehalococcoidia bacterium]|nr:CRISPR-associated protein Cas4 [Dehalococcoidia bacterium]MCL0076029.1 CRISPR-associated protein Cas4 [Dehalococcoidia bacterium]MCL0092636.1 CRISPR-associated protein Cas4 [Dehalococcoidia bacterium]MCL0094041.1 CRISPR-associated protein Cas4 [Dehalococcoidia bacterium]